MTTKCLIFGLWLQLLVGLGLWNFIKCDCPFPEEEIKNGYYVNPIETSHAPETYLLIVRCSAGYKMVGSNKIQCFEGNWSSKVPTCKEIRCGAPPRTDNGTYVVNTNDKTKISIGMQATYSCKPGHELGDPSESRLTCILNKNGDEGIWAGEIPVCKAMKPCSDPGLPMTGSRKGDCCSVGAIVSYSCNEGFEMVGEKDIECLSSSRWSSPRPLCRPLEKHCEFPPEVPNGVVLRNSGDYALAGEDVEILCKPGYKFNGPNQYPYCNESALWEDEFGECEEITCDRPEPLANGNIPELEKYEFNDTFPYRFVLTYDCNKGYRLQGGEPWRTCKKDGWSGTVPYCEEIFCPDPGTPEQGSRHGNSFKVGARVRFGCFTGFELLGSVERYCSPTGKWTGELARCNAPTNYCPNPGTPINGIRNGEGYNEGDTMEFRCRAGFIQVGSKTRTCRADRTWNGTQTKCLGPHDFDSTEEIGRSLKHRLNEKFDEQIREYQLRLAAGGLTGEDGRALEIPSNGMLIVYFAFDVSGSIEKMNFRKGIDFAKAIVKQIGVSENDARVGAITFSKESRTVFYPMHYQNTDDVLNALDDIEYTGGGTSATSALKETIDTIKLVEKQEFFIRKNKTTVLFLITDGKANMGGSPEKEAEILKNKYKVEIFCIGITGDVRADALYQIASSSIYGDEERKNVYMLKNYERLNWLVEDITNGKIDYAQCGLGMESKMNSNLGKMLGGKRSEEPWPWMAVLFYRDPQYKQAEPKLFCGGSIINENFILTAAHCLFERNRITMDFQERTKEEILVKIGLVNLKDETLLQKLDVEAMYYHADYVPGNLYDYDIALLKIKGSIQYSAFVRPVCLPPAVLPKGNENTLYKTGEYGWVTGFGHDKQVKYHDNRVKWSKSETLKELRLPIQSNKTCISSLNEFNSQNSFTERMFCAGDGESGDDTCKGDSGGPFMQPRMNSKGYVYWTQVGIVSWGKGCGVIGQYGHYTNVQRFRTWIDQKIEESASKQEEK